VCALFQRAHPHGFETANRLGETEMRRNTFIALFGLILLFGGPASSMAQVKRVQMHIAGYLCGN
jgi:hypothetical protein